MMKHIRFGIVFNCIYMRMNWTRVNLVFVYLVKAMFMFAAIIGAATCHASHATTRLASTILVAVLGRVDFDFFNSGAIHRLCACIVIVVVGGIDDGGGGVGGGGRSRRVFDEIVFRFFCGHFRG